MKGALNPGKRVTDFTGRAGAENSHSRIPERVVVGRTPKKELCPGENYPFRRDRGCFNQRKAP